MKTVASELEKLRDIVAALPVRRILPANQMRPTRRVVERVLNALDTAPALPQARLLQVKSEILAAQRNGTDLSGSPRSLLRDACALLWPDADDGIDRIGLRRAILAHAAERGSTLRRVIDVWISQFASDDGSIAEAGQQIERYLAAEHRGILGFWKEAHRAWDLFDAATGPERLAVRILDEGADALAACRLDSPSRAVSGYLRATHFAVSAKLTELLSRERPLEALQHAIGFYAPDGHLRFDEKEPNGAMADAMVGAWITRGNRPSDHLRSEVLAHLRHHLGDPRVDAKQCWAGASEETRRTVRAWLSKLSLDAFFNVVGQFAQNAGMDHQWKAREAFWGDCLRKDHIRDSWLVLGDNVARAVAGNRELRGSYGTLLGGDANHSVLLMHIGDMIFAEWSHNGKLRAWPRDWKNAPALFLSRYTRSDLRADCIQFPPPANAPNLGLTGSDGLTHHHGVWQGRVAALLRAKAGIRLQPRDGGW